MNMFYDPKKKAVKPWIFVCFIVAAILALIVGLFISKKIADRTKAQEQTQVESDIFQK